MPVLSCSVQILPCMVIGFALFGTRFAMYGACIAVYGAWFCHYWRWSEHTTLCLTGSRWSIMWVFVPNSVLSLRSIIEACS